MPAYAPALPKTAKNAEIDHTELKETASGISLDSLVPHDGCRRGRVRDC